MNARSGRGIAWAIVLLASNVAVYNVDLYAQNPTSQVLVPDQTEDTGRARALQREGWRAVAHDLPRARFAVRREDRPDQARETWTQPALPGEG